MIINEIDVSSYADIPFVEKGRSMSGCDCWGIVCLIFRDFLNAELPTYVDNYENTTDEKVLATLIEANKGCDWQEIQLLQPLDVILFRLKGQPMHVGVYIGNGRFIHCIDTVGTVLEKIGSITWRDRIVGYYRYLK